MSTFGEKKEREGGEGFFNLLIGPQKKKKLTWLVVREQCKDLVHAIVFGQESRRTRGRRCRRDRSESVGAREEGKESKTGGCDLHVVD